MDERYRYPPIPNTHELYKRMKYLEARVYDLHAQGALESKLSKALQAEMEARWPETGIES